MAKSMKDAADEALKNLKSDEIKAALAKAASPGSKSSEFKVVIGLAIGAFVNPFLQRIFGVSVPEDVLISIVGLAAGYLGSRTFLKR